MIVSCMQIRLHGDDSKSKVNKEKTKRRDSYVVGVVNPSACLFICRDEFDRLEASEDMQVNHLGKERK